MVTVAVLAVLAAIAVPSFTGLINANRLASQTNELLATLQFARSEAMRSNRRVTVCASSDSVNCAAAGTAWIVRSGNELQRVLPVRAPVQLNADIASFDYLPGGMTSAGSAFTVCLAVTNPAENSRSLRIARSGQVVVSRENTGGQCQ